MSRVKVVVTADPGENVEATAAKALAMDWWMSDGRVTALILLVHSDTEVAVRPGDMVNDLLTRWHRKRQASAQEQANREAFEREAHLGGSGKLVCGDGEPVHVVSSSRWESGAVNWVPNIGGRS